jgi:MFS family permease
VIALGLTSLFTDLGAEMIVPLLPLWLATMGAGPAFLGLLEGAADALSATLKLVSGIWADKTGRDKPWVVGGYALAALARPLTAMTVTPWQVLLVRMTDRTGKGLRSAPRDAMLARSVGAKDLTRAFGLQRSLDHAGALLGPLVASALLTLGFTLSQVFWWALVPGVLAIVCASLARETPRTVPVAEKPLAAASETAPNPKRLRHFLAICALFALANSSDVFLLVRARELGMSDAALPLTWTLLNGTKMLAALAAGRWIADDKRVRWIIAGWTIYALAYLGFAFNGEVLFFWILLALYGMFHGFTEPAERAFVKSLVPRAAAGRAFGWYHALPGWLALPAAMLTGWLWEIGGAPLAFGACSAMALVCALLLLAGFGGKTSIRPASD